MKYCLIVAALLIGGCDSLNLYKENQISKKEVERLGNRLSETSDKLATCEKENKRVHYLSGMVDVMSLLCPDAVRPVAQAMNSAKEAAKK